MQPGDPYNVMPATSAAERNKEPIRSALARFLPPSGLVLEAASGAGVHAAHFARSFPSLTWQPTEFAPELLPVIAAASAGTPNVRAPLRLDLQARQLPAGVSPGSLAAVLAVNVTHISPYGATLGLLDVAAAGLGPGGLLFIYGPFLINGAATTASNAAFDASLRAADAAWGYRDAAAVLADAARVGLEKLDMLEMPAYNFLLVMRKRA
jgi:hypothetical protein